MTSDPLIPLPTIQNGALLPTLEGGTASTVKTCLDSLSYPERNNRLLSIPEPHPDTLQWVWDDQKEFKTWLHHGRGVFWLHGKPGCGKSTLMKYLSQSLQSKSKHVGDWTVFVHFYFNNQGSDLEKSMEGLLRSFLLQILQQAPSLFDQIQHIYRHLIRKDLKWSLAALQQLFTSVFDASGHEQRFWLSIDALDECEGALREHVAFLQKIAAEHQSTLWMCISSRPLPALVAQLGSHSNLVLQDNTLTDISHFVEDKLRSAHVNMDADVIWLRDEIIEKANGVFLWVHLVVEEIFEGYEEGDTVSELRDRLSAIPSGLDQLFMRIWRMIDKRHTQEAIAMLNALVCAIRPLTLSEFRYALALSSKESIPSLRHMTLSEDLVRNDIEMTKRIRSRCGGLVEVSNNIVQFIHQSVKDWMQILDVTNASEPDRKVDQIRNHQPLLQACLRYLVLPETMELRVSAIRTQPFASYATYYWLNHYRKSEEDGSSQAEQLVEFFSPNKPYFQNWSRMYHILKRTERGSELETRRRRSRPSQAGGPLPRDSDSRFPETVVERNESRSLGLGVVVAPPDSLNEWELQSVNFGPTVPSPAITVTEPGTTDIMVRPATPLNQGDSEYKALKSESSFPEPVVKRNESRSPGLGVVVVDPDSLNEWELQSVNFGPTVPSPAITVTEPGTTDTVVRLAVPPNQGDSEYTALQSGPSFPDSTITAPEPRAADFTFFGAPDGDPIVVADESDSDPNTSWSSDNDHNWTPFSFAAEHNLFNFLTSRITHGTNVNLPGGEYGWPLQAAVVAGHLPIVRLLLDHGADIDAEGGRFGTAIAAAITLEYPEMIALLRKRGADVERCPPQSPYMAYGYSKQLGEMVGSWYDRRRVMGGEGVRQFGGETLIPAPRVPRRQRESMP